MNIGTIHGESKDSREDMVVFFFFKENIMYSLTINFEFLIQALGWLLEEGTYISAEVLPRQIYLKYSGVQSQEPIVIARGREKVWG